MINFENSILQLMKKISCLLFLIILTTGAGHLFAQTQAGPFTVSGSGFSTAVVNDYQCVGMNPANLGWKANNRFLNFGLAEESMSVYSEPLKRALVDDLFSSKQSFTEQDKEQAVIDFTGTKLQFEFDIVPLGISYQDEQIGGIGFIVRERLVWDSYLNKSSADILFNGYNSEYFDTIQFDPESGDSVGVSLDPEYVTSLFEDSRLEMSWFREYNLSYGRKIYGNDRFKLFGGIGIKYIKGYSIFNYSYKDGAIRAFSALNPIFQVNYDTYSPSEIMNSDYQSVGSGWGLDFGLSAVILDKIRIALSLTDLGQIKWNGNVYEGEDARLNDIETSGMNNYNIFELDDNIAFNNLKLGGWKGLENKTTKLPMNVRFGGSYLLKDKFEFGTELYVPTNDVPGSYDKLIFGVGTRITPVKWFRGSIGLVSGGATGTNIPVGISFFPFNNKGFSWEIGFAVRDITTYLSQNNPTVSLAMGFLRFGIGSNDE
jgi:hypothetical protein